MSKPGRFFLFPLLLVMVILGTAQPVFSCHVGNFSWYDWTNGYEIQREERDAGLKAGQDIRNAFYSLQNGYHYFRLELYGDSSGRSRGSRNVLGFFLDTGSDQQYSQFSTLLGMDIDSFFDVSSKAGRHHGGNSGFDSGTLVAGREFSFEFHFERNGKYLDWAIPESQLPKDFSWLAAAFTKDRDGNLKLVDKSVDAGIPIPGTAWLFGSGIAGLAAVIRKKRGAGKTEA